MCISNVPAIVVLSLYFHKKLSLATGSAVCGNGFGVFAFAPLANALLLEYSWKGTVLIEAGIYLNCILCGMIFRPLKIITVLDEIEVVASDEVKESESVYTITAVAPDIGDSQNTEPQKSDILQLAELLERTDIPPASLDQPTNSITVEMRKMSVKCASSPELYKLATATEGLQFRQCSFRSVRQSASSKARTDVFHAKSLDHVAQTQGDCDNVDSTTLPEIHQPQSGLAIDNITNKSHQTTTKIMDFRLLLNVPFILFAVSNFFSGFGYVVPYIFLPNRGRVLGFSSSQSSWLVSMLGISNIVGRIATGVIANLKCVNKLLFYNTVRLIWGIATLLSVLLYTFPLQMCYSFLFGFINGQW